MLELMRRHKRLRVAWLTFALALLATSGAGMWYASQIATAQESSQVEYEHSGQFGWSTHANPGVLYSDDFELPADEATSSPDSINGMWSRPESATSEPVVFFREVLGDLALAFTYSLDCNEPLERIRNQVTVTVTAIHPGMWSKELYNWTRWYTTGECRLEVPFPLGDLETAVDRIEDDIGIHRSQQDYLIEAVVHTVAETYSGQRVRAEFAQSLEATLTEKLLQIQGALEASGDDGEGDLKWTSRGRFDYEASVDYNSLYESVVLRSEPLPTASVYEPPAVVRKAPSILIQVHPGTTLFPQTMTSCQGAFSYDFACAGQVYEAAHDAEVCVLLSDGLNWSKRLTLLPTTPIDAGSTVRFPVDIAYLDQVVRAISEQTGVRVDAYEMDFEATVRTSARTASGMIDDIYTQVVEARRDGAVLRFGEDDFAATRLGTISGGNSAGSSGTGDWLPPSIAGAVASAAMLGVLAVARARTGRNEQVSAAVARAVRKHKHVLVNVKGLSSATPSDRVVQITSLEDLVRAADDAVKPVLYHRDGRAHTFCVLDGTIRYEYVIPGDAGDEPERVA